MADTGDLKSPEGDLIRVRVPSRALDLLREFPALNGRALVEQLPAFAGRRPTFFLRPRRRGIALLKHGGAAPWNTGTSHALSVLTKSAEVFPIYGGDE